MKTVTFDETKFQLVPVEPTNEMISAMGAYDGSQHSNPADADDFKDDYRALLDAAPQPPSAEHPQGGQEPYAWMSLGGSIWRHKTREDDVPLYTTPQQPKTLTDALTDEDICKLIVPGDYLTVGGLLRFARSVEQALREKNG